MDSVGEILKRTYASKSPNHIVISSNAEGLAPDSEAVGVGQPDCPHCGGDGFVVPDVPPAHPAFGRAVPCDCRDVEREQARIDSLQQMSQLGMLLGCTFESFLPEGHGLTSIKLRNLKLAYERALAYAQEPAGWLVLKGGYGCGKTHLAAAIGNYNLTQGRPVLFVNAPDLLDHLRAAYAPNATVSYDERFEQIRNVPLLILDDLGSQHSTEWAQEKLYQIFNYRYNNRLPTVITTNEELEAIELRIQSRMVDPDLVQIVHILAPDFRRAGVDQEQSDLSTLNLHAEQTFETFDLRERELPHREAENLRRALDVARAYAQEPQDWLILNSTAYGNGKTHLAAAIANYVANRGEPVLFIVVPDLLDHLRKTFNPESGVRFDKRFAEIRTAPLLVLDDLGTESATAFAREKLYQLFDYRYNARLPTVITTAEAIDELNPKLESRMMDTSHATYYVLEVPSYRGRSQRRRPQRR